MLAKLDGYSSSTGKVKAPTFYRFEAELDDIADTFIDCSRYGKGCISVNGFNLGRYWNEGPIHYLYVPSDLLKDKNEFIVFETENVKIEELTLTTISL